MTPMSDETETLPKMAADLKSLWLAALRSGDYAQCDGQLRDDIDDETSYCCLGVLCEAAGLNYEPSDGYLKMAVAERTGLPKTTQEILSGLNDGCLNDLERKIVGDLYRPDLVDGKHSFARIADFI